MDPAIAGKWLQSFFWLVGGVYVCLRLFRDLRGKSPSDYCAAQVAANAQRHDAHETTARELKTALTSGLETLGNDFEKSFQELGRTFENRISDKLAPVRITLANHAENIGANTNKVDRVAEKNREDVGNLYNTIRDQRTEIVKNLNARLDKFEETDRETQKTLMSIAVKVGALSGKDLKD